MHVAHIKTVEIDFELSFFYTFFLLFCRARKYTANNIRPLNELYIIQNMPNNDIVVTNFCHTISTVWLQKTYDSVCLFFFYLKIIFNWCAIWKFFFNLNEVAGPSFIYILIEQKIHTLYIMNEHFHKKKLKLIYRSLTITTTKGPFK